MNRKQEQAFHFAMCCVIVFVCSFGLVALAAMQ